MASGGTATLKRKPRSILLSGDGSQALTGSSPKSGLHWTSWRARAAFATGYVGINDCSPDCAHGRFHYYAAKIEEYQPAKLGGKLVFARLRFEFVHRPPRPYEKHNVLKAQYTRQGSVWGLGLI